MSSEIDDLEQLTRAQLQQRAKALGIKANMKSSELIAAIRIRAMPPQTPKTPGQLRKRIPSSSGSDDMDGSPRVADDHVPRLPCSVLSSRLSNNLSYQSRIDERPPIQKLGSPKSTNNLGHTLGNKHVTVSPSPSSKPHETFDNVSMLRKYSASGQTNILIMEEKPRSETLNENSPTNNNPKPFDLKQAMRIERERRRSIKMSTETSAWERIESKSKPGHYYFWNAATQQATWEAPPGF